MSWRSISINFMMNRKNSENRFHRVPITEEVKEFGEIGRHNSLVFKISETSYFQSQMHFDDCVESIADCDLEDGKQQKMLTSPLYAQKASEKLDVMVVQEREVGAQFAQPDRKKSLSSHSSEERRREEKRGEARRRGQKRREEERRGEERRGEERRGEERRGEERRGEERRGEARRGEARRGEARRGEARRGEERRGEERRGEERRGEERRGEERRREEKRGEERRREEKRKNMRRT